MKDLKMEDHVFEIRIWANIAGFGEVKFAKSLKGLFPEKRDSKDPLGLDDLFYNSFKSGDLLIVYFEKDVYIIVKKTAAPPEAKYRDTPVYLAVAIKRGYHVNLLKFFAQLENDFNALASQYKDGMRKN